MTSAQSTRRAVKALLFVVLLIFIAGGTFHFFFKSDPLKVSIVTAKKDTVEEIAVNTKAGTVESRHRARLSTALGGRVAKLNVREGDRVVKGQVLLEVESSEHRARVDQARRGVAVAREEAARLKIESDERARDLERTQNLHRGGALSRQELDRALEARNRALAAAQVQDERIAEARAALAGAEANLDLGVIRAPFSGVVSKVETEIGEYLSPSPPGVNLPSVIEVIGDKSGSAKENLYVSAPMDEIDANRIVSGMKARVTLDAFPDSNFAGVVIRTAPFVLDREEQNRTFEVEVGLLDPPEGLLPGVTADVEVILSARENVVVVPTYAIADRARVFVVRDGKAAVRAVTIGIGNWEETEIVEGVAEGDVIVTNIDNAELKDGVEVAVAEETK